MADEGVFEVKSGDNTYIVDFKRPLCTCPDWIQTNYPCKHFFAVFRIYPTWDWNALPSTYLESSLLSLDKEALDDYFSANHPTLSSPDTSTFHRDDNENTMEDFTASILKGKVHNITCNYVINLIDISHYHLLQSIDRDRKEAMKAKVNLKAIEGLTYTCIDPQLLRKLNNQYHE